MEEPEPLYVDCRNCGLLVPAGFRLTAEVYELSLEDERSLTCPNCGVTSRYTKAEFHILPSPSAH